MPFAPLSMVDDSAGTGPPGPPSVDKGGHDTEKLLLKAQVSEDFV